MGKSLPLFPLNTVLFPGMVLPLHIFEERYRRLLAERAGFDPAFGIVLITHGHEVAATAEVPQLAKVGTAATLVASGQYPDGRSDIVVRGTRRFVVNDADWSTGFPTADVDWLPDLATASEEQEQIVALKVQVSSLFQAYVSDVRAITGAEEIALDLPEDPQALGWELAELLPMTAPSRQLLLEATTLAQLLGELVTHLRTERSVLRNLGAAGSPSAHPGRGFSPN